MAEAVWDLGPGLQCDPLQAPFSLAQDHPPMMTHPPAREKQEAISALELSPLWAELESGNG